ncbi:unnamed protein product [Amoebophrya sp. A25]|nr:unnamed protein product [Amoebophrya sp. A25]|eukprot:GSA25T00017742001.1
MVSGGGTGGNSTPNSSGVEPPPPDQQGQKDNSTTSEPHCTLITPPNFDHFYPREHHCDLVANTTVTMVRLKDDGDDMSISTWINSIGRVTSTFETE